jgi:osmoprotectant transport system permease protein
VAGLAVNDTARMLAGALPAAVLALVVQALFWAIERQSLPAGLRAARQPQTPGAS